MNAKRDDEEKPGFAHEVRGLLLAWVALIALLLSSLGGAYLSLGSFNPVLSIGIALLKSAIVVWLFMQMRQASALVRLAAASGLAMLALLAGLTGVDYATRASTPAVMQPPQQLSPLLEEKRS